jgi:hypothetical protein
MADTMTVTVSANSPMPLMDARASAACSSNYVCRMISQKNAGDFSAAAARAVMQLEVECSRHTGMVKGKLRCC